MIYINLAYNVNLRIYSKAAAAAFFFLSFFRVGCMFDRRTTFGGFDEMTYCHIRSCKLLHIIHFFFSEYLFLELFTLSSHPKKHKYFKHNYLPSHESFSDPTWCPMDNRLQMEFCLSLFFF
jgi:hypothetical protein